MRRSTVRFRQAAPSKSPGQAPDRGSCPGLFLACAGGEQPTEQPSSVAPECPVHPIGGLLRHLRRNVRVGVEDDADLRMSQDFHDDAGRHTVGEQHTGSSVPEIMDTYVTQIGVTYELPKESVVVAGMDPACRRES
jgi:hypothetical protein